MAGYGWAVILTAGRGSLSVYAQSLDRLARRAECGLLGAIVQDSERAACSPLGGTNLSDYPSEIAAAADDSVYRCPRSGVALAWNGGRLESPDGSVVYEAPAGVPRFSTQPSPESEKVRARLDRVNELARAGPWEDAVREVYGDWQYIYPAGRDKWIGLLDIEPDATVLEIGPGMGQFTPLLSRMCKDLYALEVVPEQAEFAIERARQSGCTNVRMASGGDDCLLPYKDATFDWVVMNLVFEWCASRKDSEADPAAGQRQMLSELCRVLKPGGRLYLCTKNRYALRLVIGKRDEHCDSMRWGNALPRRLMRLAMRVKGKSQPRGLLHSHNTLRGMLHDAGFDDARSFWAVPEMRHPAACVPLTPQAVRAARREPGFVQGEYKITRALMPLVPASLVKHVTPGLQFVARKRVS